MPPQRFLGENSEQRNKMRSLSDVVVPSMCGHSRSVHCRGSGRRKQGMSSETTHAVLRLPMAGGSPVLNCLWRSFGGSDLVRRRGAGVGYKLPVVLGRYLPPTFIREVPGTVIIA